MYCPNCGEQIPDRSRLCGFCGYRLGAAAPPPPQPQYPQQPAPIIVQAPRSGSFFSGCGGLLNLAFSLMALAAIAFFVLVFLCVIRLPAEFPIVGSARAGQRIMVARGRLAGAELRQPFE